MKIDSMGNHYQILKGINDAIKICMLDYSLATFHDMEEAEFYQVIQGSRHSKNYLEEHAFR